MTEVQWRACDDPDTLLAFAGGRASNRQLRLFACACCRRLWPALTGAGHRHAVETSERYADRLAHHSELRRARADAWGAVSAAGANAGPARAAAVRGLLKEARAAAFEVRALAADLATRSCTALPEAVEAWRLAEAAERGAQSVLLRDILGNPFRPVSLDPSWVAWNGAAVRNMAQAAYDERAFDTLPVLADALEDAGCTDEQILTHCRGSGPHARGCWVLDLLTGKD